jgi:succinyl-CoA:acetate CoA-transferase
LRFDSSTVERHDINEGCMEYVDIHLSHVAQFVWFGFLGKLGVAVVEVAGITRDGLLIPATSVGTISRGWISRTRLFWR